MQTTKRGPERLKDLKTSYPAAKKAKVMRILQTNYISSEDECVHSFMVRPLGWQSQMLTQTKC